MRSASFAVVLLLAGCASALHREPTETLRQKILLQTPPGTSLPVVRKVATEYNAGCLGGTHERDMNRNEELMPVPPIDARRFLDSCADSGWAFPFRAYTVVRWYFDESDELLSVRVLREADGL